MGKTTLEKKQRKFVKKLLKTFNDRDDMLGVAKLNFSNLDASIELGLRYLCEQPYYEDGLKEVLGSHKKGKKVAKKISSFDSVASRIALVEEVIKVRQAQVPSSIGYDKVLAHDGSKSFEVFFANSGVGRKSNILLDQFVELDEDKKTRKSLARLVETVNESENEKLQEFIIDSVTGIMTSSFSLKERKKALDYLRSYILINPTLERKSDVEMSLTVSSLDKLKLQSKLDMSQVEYGIKESLFDRSLEISNPKQRKKIQGKIRKLELDLSGMNGRNDFPFLKWVRSSGKNGDDIISAIEITKKYDELKKQNLDYLTHIVGEPMFAQSDLREVVEKTSPIVLESYSLVKDLIDAKSAFKDIFKREILENENQSNDKRVNLVARIGLNFSSVGVIKNGSGFDYLLSLQNNDDLDSDSKDVIYTALAKPSASQFYTQFLDTQFVDSIHALITKAPQLSSSIYSILANRATSINLCYDLEINGSTFSLYEGRSSSQIEDNIFGILNLELNSLFQNSSEDVSFQKLTARVDKVIRQFK